MKKGLLIITCLLTIGFIEVRAQWVNIPDAKFALFLRYKYPTCMNGNLMDTTCVGITTDTFVSCRFQGIFNLDGIQYFDALTKLDCSANDINNIPGLPASLTSLWCNENELVNLPELPSSLIELLCHTNLLTSLPVLPGSLNYLDCGFNKLTSLPALPGSLTRLYCNSNKLNSLPALPASLTYLACQFNQLNSLPGLPASLTEIYCKSNQLISLPVLPISLTKLNCPNNQLTNLPSLPASLKTLWCDDNYITTLPALPDSLTALLCANNLLTSLPSLPASLLNLSCSFNMLTSLPPLPSTLVQFEINNNPLLLCVPHLKRYTGGNSGYNISQTGIRCLPNPIIHSGYIPAIDTMPICDLFNNNGCPVSWNISGSVYKDSIIQCIRDSTEPLISNIKLNLYKDTSFVQSFYSTNGKLYFDTDTSTYVLSIDTTNLPFDFTCPANGKADVSVTSQDSLKTGVDFGLKCKPGFDIGAKSIFGSLFRPSWLEAIYIKAGDMGGQYGVSCNSGISGNVNITITGPVKYVSPGFGALTPTTASNTLLTYNVADFSTVNFSNDFNIVIRTDTTAQAGQQVCITVAITSTGSDNNPSNNTLTQCFSVRTSYDPNDKTVYPDGDISPGQDWLNYTIRFQNTGNDTAIHIQVIDTLDSNIDVASFKLLAYSHPNITQILQGGLVKFNFPNIYLPDSNVNEPLSHGYVQYKVKLKGNLPIGTKVRNTAYIYFDFNAPVVTNTTVNTISTAVGISSAFQDGAIRVYPNPANSMIMIETMPGQDIFITNLLGELFYHEKSINGRKEIDISHLPSGMYFVNNRKFVKE